MSRLSPLLFAALCCFFVWTADASLLAGKKETKPKEPTAAQKKIARAIGTGHAFEKHVIDEKQFPDVKNENDFIEVIAKVLANPTHHKDLENDREAYYDKKANIIIIYNPRARDKGTCFRPRNGLKYFQNLK